MDNYNQSQALSVFQPLPDPFLVSLISMLPFDEQAAHRTSPEIHLVDFFLTIQSRGPSL